ncbi:MAG: SDR family NAD(P)-dependent oxidoreductase [Solirubrobacterales bacterium]
MSEEMAPLAGEVAVVTGAARAIGREIAEVLARRGAAVCSIDLVDSAETIAAIEGAGGSAMAVRADVTDEDALAAAREQLLERLGRVDVLVNNAGLFAGLERRPFWEIDTKEWQRVLRTNVDSVFKASKCFSKPMREAARGRVVNIASNVVTFGMPNLMHYVASKAAVVGITRGMARELGAHGIAVNAVSPGLVTTEVTREAIPEDYRRQVAEGQCLTEALLPEDIAGAVAWLCGPDARLVSGQTILVNGGASMGPT